jgi:hypothetical protein
VGVILNFNYGCCDQKKYSVYMTREMSPTKNSTSKNMTQIMTQISTQAMTDMHYPNEIDMLIEMDQCLIDEGRQKSINPTWHWSKKGAIEDGVNSGYRDQCIVARDQPNGKKQFASIPSSCGLPALTKATLPQDRHFYECLGAGTTQKPYFDIEYYNQPTDYTWQHLCVFLGLLSLALKREFHEYLQRENPLFGITDSSRWVAGGQYKHSFHIVIQNLFVESPDHILKVFVMMFIVELENLSAALHEAALQEDNTGLAKLLSDVPLHMIVDDRVYTSFQQMRMPLSSKSNDGTVTVLTGLYTDFDPLSLLDPEPDSDLLGRLRSIIRTSQSVIEPRKFDENDVEAHRDFYLTLINRPDEYIALHTLPDNSVLHTQILPQSSLSANHPKRKRDIATQRIDKPEVELPLDVHSFLYTLMQKPEFEFTEYNVTKKLITNSIDGNFNFTIPIRRVCGAASRCPLQLSGEVAHASNNQMIGIWYNGAMAKIRFKCHSKHCEGRRAEMGVLPSELLQQLLCLTGVSNDVMQEDNCNNMAMDTDNIETASDVQPNAKKAKKPFVDLDADKIAASAIQARDEQMDYRADFAQLAPDVFCANR